MNRDILDRLQSADHLPMLPAVAVEVLRLSRDPDSQMTAFVDLIGRDPSLTAKVLRTVNSSWFGLSREITSLQQALALLGLQPVRALVLSFSLVNLRQGQTDDSFDYGRFWKQALSNAVTARELLTRHQTGNPEEAFVAGLLQDLGVLALLQVAPDEYQQVVAKVDESGEPVIYVERDTLGTDHMEVGAWLADRWGLPSRLCYPVAHHHEPDQCEGADQEANELTHLLYAAALVGELLHDRHKQRPQRLLGEALQRQFAMDPDQVDEFMSELLPKIADTAKMFDMDIGTQQDYAAILAEANAELARLSLEAAKETALSHQREARLEQRAEKLEEERERLQDRAIRDRLTGTYNRGLFDEMLTKEYKRGMRYHRRVGLIMADVDHFKRVNDTYGHPFGDEVLCTVADALRQGIRDSDILARYGGEEFAIIVIEPTEKGLNRLTERLRVLVRDALPAIDGKIIRVTASFGAVICQPRRDDEEGETRLLKSADEALYQAKEAGRNRVCFVSLLDEADRQVEAAVEAMRFSRQLVKKGVVGVKELNKALILKKSKRFKIGYLAVKLGMLSEERLHEILDVQARTNKRFGHIAVTLGLLTPRQVVWLLAVQREDPETLGAALVASKAISPQHLRRHLERYYRMVAAGAGSPLPSTNAAPTPA